MTITEGTMIGRYQIVRELGVGGFSIVYLSTDVELQRQVAIKIPRHPPEYFQGSKNSPTFISARMLAQLQHPAIATVFDINTRDDPAYVVMEYLAQSVVQEMKLGKLTMYRTVGLTLSVADALDYVHRRGIVHRNVKPGAILLDPTGLPRLSGFEVAYKQGTTNRLGMAGTRSYMSPEQWRDDEAKLGPHTDVWGLGVCLYEMLTETRPFIMNARGSEPKRSNMEIDPGSPGRLRRSPPKSELKRAILEDEPISPRLIDPTIPEELERICLRCLAKEPAARYPSMAPIIQSLRDWQKRNEQVQRPRVFISHSTRDREFVEREIIPILESQGIKTWYSKADIHTAVQWERSILEGLESCGLFLLVMSLRAAESEWVKDEVHWAIEKRPGKIIPVMIEKCDPRSFHIRMARIQHVDFRDHIETAHAELLVRLQLDHMAG